MSRHTLFAIVLLLLPATASAGQYRDLCASVPGACEPTGPDAPTIDVDVCWNETGALELKGDGSCTEGSWPYHLKYGEIADPMVSTVIAYRPLDNACDHPGLCVHGPAPEGAEGQSICCEWGVCVPLSEVACNSASSFAVFCVFGETHADGTVTCYDGDYLQ